jgi:Bacterial Ig domain
MKYFKIITAILLVSSLCWTGCIKDIKMGNDTPTAPTVKVLLPIEGDQFVNGQSITIKGDIVDAATLKSVTIKVIDDKTGMIYYTNSLTSKDVSNNTFNVAWVAKVPDWSDSTVTVTIENASNQMASKAVKIKIWL